MQKIKIPFAVLALSNAFWAWIEKRPIENILFSAFLGVLLIVWYVVIRKIEQKAASSSQHEDILFAEANSTASLTDVPSDHTDTSLTSAEENNSCLSDCESESDSQPQDK